MNNRKKKKFDNSVRYITLDQKHQEKNIFDDVKEPHTVDDVSSENHIPSSRNASGLVAPRTTFPKVTLSEHNNTPNLKVAAKRFEIIE